MWERVGDLARRAGVLSGETGGTGDVYRVNNFMYELGIKNSHAVSGLCSKEEISKSTQNTYNT